MKFYLKNNWSEQFKYDDVKLPGFFVGREQEKENLKHILEYNDSSTILVSSVRGVGKTSFVHKALREIKDESKKAFFPAFVNIGHILSDTKNDKRLVLSALLRAFYFNEDLLKTLNKKEKEEIKDLYEKATGEFEIKKEKGEDKKNGFEWNIRINLNLNTEAIIKLFATLIGTALSFLGFRFGWQFTLIGGCLLLFSIGFHKYSKKYIYSSKLEINKINDETGYLEILFENWLKEQYKNDKKIIFVIDELDKIGSEKAFEFIKEFKNLFTRSFAHFIFISDQEGYELATKNNREDTVANGGHFPTFFTHVSYLSLPSNDEIKEYLKSVFDYENLNKENQNNLDDLMKYLQFKSGNDFFVLKRLLSDFSLFDSKGSYIDVDAIKNSDKKFDKKSKLFGYVKKWFIDYNWNNLKIGWEDNSKLQNITFNFLNKFYPSVFFDKDLDSNIKKDLAQELIRIGHYQKRNVTVDDVKMYSTENLQLKEGDYIYECTNNYNHNDVSGKLREEEKELKKEFLNMVKVANILDDLPEAYNDETKFSKEEKIIKERDGREYSDINLYATYIDLIELKKNIMSRHGRISLKKEEISDALKTIKEQLNTIWQNYFKIIHNLLNKILSDEIIKQENFAQVVQLFNDLPNFNPVFNNYETYVYRKNDNSKKVLLVKDFNNFVEIENGLNILRNNKNILVINLKIGEKYSRKSVEIFVDKRGKRKKPLGVSNFITFTITSIKDLSKIMKVVNDHFL